MDSLSCAIYPSCPDTFHSPPSLSLLLVRFQYCNTSGSPLSMYVSRLLLRQKYIFKNIDLEHPFQKRLSKMLMIYSAVCLSVTLHYLNVSNHESGLLLLEAKGLKYFPVCFVGLLV